MKFKVIEECICPAITNVPNSKPKVYGNLYNAATIDSILKLPDKVSSTYKNLRRMAKLPPQEGLNRIQDEKVKKAISNVAEGKFNHAKVKYIKAKGVHDKQIQDPRVFYLNGNTEDNNLTEDCLIIEICPHTEDVDALGNTFFLWLTSDDGDERYGFGSSLFHVLKNNLDLHSSTNRNMIVEVTFRLFHMLFRDHGLKISKLGESKDGTPSPIKRIFCENVRNFIVPYWTKTSNHKLAIDASITAIDIAIMLDDDHKYDIHRFLHDLGEIYEAKKQFEIAGDLYGDAYTFSLDEGRENCIETQRCVICYNAGVAYKNCLQLEKAEPMFVRVWHHKFKYDGCVPDDSVIRSTLLLYDKLQCLDQTGSLKFKDGKISQMKPDQMLHSILGCLIKTTGIDVSRPNEKNLFNNMLKPKEILKKKYLIAKNARKALNNLATEPTTESFRERILDTCRLDRNDKLCCRMLLNPDIPEFSRDKLRKTHAKSIKKQVRNGEAFQSDFIQTHTAQECAQCGAKTTPTGGKLLSCPCNDEFYCGSECQKKHWKTHKLICSIVKKKKSAAKGKTKK